MRFALSLGNDDGLASGATAFEYDDHGRLTKLGLRNGAYSTYQYDRGARLTRLVNYHSPYADTGAGVTRYVAASNTYEYDDNSNILAIEQDFNGTPIRTEYEYDPLNRLTRETTCEYMNLYVYSAAGDRTRMIHRQGYSYEDGGTKFYMNAWEASAPPTVCDYYYNAAHELTKMESVTYPSFTYVTRTYNYDQAGRLTRQAKVKTGESAVTWTYEWDALDRLTKGQKSVSGGATDAVAYGYNAEGLRVRRIDTDAAVTKLYSYQGNNIASVQTGSAASGFNNNTFIYSGLERHHPDFTANTTASQYYQYDHRGNVACVTDSGGKAKYGYQYDAFGNIASSFEEGQSEGPMDDILFTGKDWDADLELYYFNARWYDPEVGRFISRAKFDPDEEHPYVLCESNPVFFVDESGQRVELCKTTAFFIIPRGHHYIRVVDDQTGEVIKSRGQGSGGGNGRIPTEWTDHSHRKGKCRPVNNVDECCVLREIKGDLGGYNLISNNCQQAVREVLEKCRIKRARLIEGPTPIEGFSSIR